MDCVWFKVLASDSDKESLTQLGAAKAFNPSILQAEVGGSLYKFEPSLVYMVKV